jgi:hypothetical protein
VEVEAIASAIRQAVAEHHELQVYAVLLLKPGSLPKTSSGKVQRQACRASFMTNSLATVGQSLLEARPGPPVPTREDSFILKALSAIQAPDSRQKVLVLHLQEQLAQVLKVPAAQLSPQRPLTVLGLDARGAAELVKAIDSSLGITLPLAYLLEAPTLDQLAAHLLCEREAFEARRVEDRNAL